MHIILRNSCQVFDTLTLDSKEGIFMSKKKPTRKKKQTKKQKTKNKQEFFFKTKQNKTIKKTK